MITNKNWRAISAGYRPCLDQRVLVTNRPDVVDNNGDPKHIWVGCLYNGSCGQTHAQTDDGQKVMSVTHFHPLPKFRE